MKKIAKLILINLIMIIFLTGCKSEKKYDINIISTSFPGYDFARAITRDNSNVGVKMLLKPGSESHHYEPTPQDIKNIQDSDIFIYVGGDSDEWITEVLENIDSSKTKIIKMIDLVDKVEEEEVEGMEMEEEEEDEIEYDEHVWTSPKNAIKIIEKLTNEIVKIDKKNENLYLNNSSNYIDEINSIDSEIRNVVENSKRKEIIFADRFPIRYFSDEYNLKYYAAFPGCSEQTEASAKTISFLIKKVKDDNIPVVFHIELSNGKIAKEIAKETGAKVLEFNSAHNISQSDFDKGITYTDIMKKNIKVLKEALN